MLIWNVWVEDCLNIASKCFSTNATVVYFILKVKGK